MTWIEKSMLIAKFAGQVFGGADSTKEMLILNTRDNCFFMFVIQFFIEQQKMFIWRKEREKSFICAYSFGQNVE